MPVTDEARRGLLGHGSVLAVTSHAERTSPVLRGKWVLENLLGLPVPPPPPDVPSLKGNEEGQKPRTLREQLAEHRASPVCASCHKVMDPVGFALENFDAVGAWRTREPGGPIDASGQLADGTPVDGVVTLRRAILERPELVVGTMTEKLLTYALGRGVEARDMPAVRAIVREAAKRDYRLSAICHGGGARACRSRCGAKPGARPSDDEDPCSSRKKSLPRRTFLRGMGVAVSLPLVDAMVPALTPWARAQARPRTRFGAIYVPNGAIMEQWIPEAVGRRVRASRRS